MKRVKLLLVVTLSEIGGAQKVVYNIAAGLDHHLFDVTVATAPGGELLRWLKELPQKVSVFEIPELKRNISPYFDMLALIRLYRLVRRERFNVVHIHSSKAGILGRLAAWMAGVPKIFFTVHGWGINEYQNWLVRFLYTWAERLAGAVSTKVICVSENDLEKGRTLRLVADNKLTVIYNGLPEPERRKGNLRQELGLKNEDVIVGMVARLASPKEPLFYLELARRLLKRGAMSETQTADSPRYNDHEMPVDRIFFVVIGDGPLRDECEAFIHKYGVAERVFLLGSREDAAELVWDFNVFTLFSRWEGLPLTIIEAMQAGVPVVANDVGGVGELVVDGETGFLIRGLDLEAAAQALLRLLSNQNLRRRMGDAGRQRARRKFSLEEMLSRYRKLYLESPE